MATRLQAAAIADDLTGANAVAALFRAAGLRSFALLAHEQLSIYLSEFEALAVDADTRSLAPRAAYERVRGLAELCFAAGARLVGKRIDSTLRGNIGAEIDAVLDAAEPGSVALVVAAVPMLGRVTVGGYLLAGGRPLLETAAAADPWAPPRSSDVAEVIATQSRQAIGQVTLAAIGAGADAVRRRLQALASVGTRLIVADATTDAHIEMLADACQGLPIIPVDPGPFSAALVRRSAAPRRHLPPILAVVGSVTARTHAQLVELLTLPGAELVVLNAAALCGPAAADELDRGLAALREARAATLLILTAARGPDAVLDLAALQSETGLDPEGAARRIAAGLAECVARLLETGAAVGGIYTTGGAVTQAAVHRLGASGIEVERSILPLAVLGRLRGGTQPGLPLVSKGGLVGNDRAAVRCIEALQIAAAGGANHVCQTTPDRRYDR